MDLIGLSILYGILGALIIFKYEKKLHSNNIKIIDLKAEIDRRMQEKIETKLDFDKKLKQMYQSIEEERQIDEGYKAKYDDMLQENLRLNRKLNDVIGGKQ